MKMIKNLTVIPVTQVTLRLYSDCVWSNNKPL